MNLPIPDAPLVEIVAEVRWETPRSAIMAQATPGIAFNFPQPFNSDDEAFYANFGADIERMDFRNSERLPSAGMPGQIAIRYRRSANTAPLLQVGSGVFALNDLPPTYDRWESFIPTLRGGLEALLANRSEAEANAPFSASLRYINAFSEERWGGKTASAFLRETLGLSVPVPAAIWTDQSLPIHSSVQMSIPLQNSQTLQLSANEGAVNGSPAVILDLTAQVPNVAPELDLLVETFSSAHGTVSTAFGALTAQIFPARDLNA